MLQVILVVSQLSASLPAEKFGCRACYFFRALCRLSSCAISSVAAAATAVLGWLGGEPTSLDGPKNLAENLCATLRATMSGSSQEPGALGLPPELRLGNFVLK